MENERPKWKSILPFFWKMTLPHDIVLLENDVFGEMLQCAENVVISGTLTILQGSHIYVFGAPFLCWDFRNILFLGKWNTGDDADAQEKLQGEMRKTPGFKM